MPALMRTIFSGTVTWLGFVPDRTASLRAKAVTEIVTEIGGVPGEAHSGVTRASCSRVTSQHPEGTLIANVRQMTLLGAEELAEIADRMGMAAVDPTWLGASMVVSGIPDFSHLPPSSRLQAPSGATLVVDMENRPCQFPAREIEQDAPGYGKAFKPAAAGRRGVTAWVERGGVIRLGDTLSLHVPDQRAWVHLNAARSA